MWVRAGMFAIIIVLVALILITPNLLGHPSELASLPILIVAMSPDQREIIVDVTSAVQAYLYGNVSVEVRSLAANNTTVAEYAHNDSFGESVYVPANATPLYVHVRLVDRQLNFFEDNVTVTLGTDPTGKVTMTFAFPTDPGTTAISRTPPDDFRWVVPRRGMLP